MKIVISFTTSPTRINKCSQMIHSILDQTRKPDLFLLNIPEEFARTGESYVVPKYIRKSLTVNRIQCDYGPATKIVPTVLYLSERARAAEYDPENTRIIYLDDDIAYPKRMVETYEKIIAPNDNNVWTATGFDFVNLCLNGKRAHKDTATIAEGYGSVEEGEAMIRVLTSPEFTAVIRATKWGAYQTDRRMFEYFRDGFYYSSI